MHLSLADLQVLANGGATDLADAVLQLAAQEDPKPDALPGGALGPDELRARLREARRDPEAEQRRVRIALLWRQYLGQAAPPPAPRFLLADFLTALYQRDDEPARAAILELAARAPLRLGLWGGLKRIYKLAEQRQDAPVLGALAARFDRTLAPGPGDDVSLGTLVYLRRRAWRWLRHLGQAVPELYPQFAAAMLVQIPAGANVAAGWVANHILRHGAPRDGYQFYGKLPADLLEHRAFDAAWKAPAAADPLMFLLEECRHDDVARFAIQSLRRDFPQLLRAADPRWLERISRRPLASIHEFVVDTLQGSPELHAAKLRGLGLHETVLSLLVSPSAKARAYAIEYARAQAQDLPAERLVAYAASDFDETVQWAASALQRIPAKTVGHALFGRLLTTRLRDWAAAVLERSFDRSELPRPWLVDLLFGGDAQRRWAEAYLGARYAAGELGADFWKGIIDDERARTASKEVLRLAFQKLLELPPEAVGGAWALQTLQDRDRRAWIRPWLEQLEVLPGVDVEQVKGLVFDPELRPVALKLLSRPRIAGLAQLGLPWLLALARRADPALHDWATRYLLQHLSPGAFADGDAARGADRLLELATGAKEPDAVRAFAQTYLLCHHPAIGPEQPQSASYQLKPQLRLEDYRPEPYWAALRDPRPDVRRFAIAVVRASLRRWGWLDRVYELADSEHREVRNVAVDALLKAGQAGADPQCTLEPKEIDPARVFGLTESPIRATRELAMELVARHYDTLGGPERLGWLMASSDRTVRQMAARLLWERHRPRHLPPGWTPRGEALAPLGETTRFEDVEGLRVFLRTLLFSLPPGRDREPAAGEAAVRKTAAGISKRRAVEAARDLAVEDEAFARTLAPLLLEFAGSIALGEWQVCLSALLTIQRAHPGLDLGLEKRT